MKIALIGGNGALGTHLMPKLKAQNIAVRILSHVHSSPAAEAVWGDVESNLGLDELFEGCDGVINLAGRFQGNYAEQFSLNTFGVMNILEHAIKSDIRFILHISTAAVYGSADDHAFTEREQLHPDTIYGLTKSLGEEVLRYYHRNFGIRTIIIRPANIYGRWVKRGVIPDMLRSIWQNGYIQIDGDGQQTREFIHADDVAELIIRVVNKFPDYDVINLSGGQAISLNTLAETIRSLVSDTVVIRHGKPVSGFVRSLRCDSHHARETYGWEPTIPLMEGMKELII